MLIFFKIFLVGNGLENGTSIGPLINSTAIEKIKRLVDDALSKGAKVVVGGQVGCQGGTFFEPTVVEDVTEEMLLAQEETFGPIASLSRFETTDDVIEAWP